MLFALLSAMLFAITYLLVERGQRRRTVADNGIFASVVPNVVTIGAVTVVLGLVQGLPPLNVEGLAIFVLAGLLTTYLGRVFQFASQKRIGPTRATSYRITSPAFTAVIAVLFLGEVLGIGSIFGMTLVGAGLWLLMRSGGTGGRGEDRLGIALALCSAMSFGAGHATRKLGLQLIPSPFIGAFVGSCVALTAHLLKLRSSGQVRQVWRETFLPVEWNLLGAGIVAGFAQMALYLSFALAPVSLAAALSATEPLFTALFARRFGSADRNSPQALLGIAITVLGVAAILLLQGR